MTTYAQIHGSVEPGFEKVAEAFAANFEQAGETGAACAVYAGDRPLVDLWAGSTARGPWVPGARSVLFSVSKGITTVCLLMAAEAGHLRLDEPVTTYWPEYGARGKQDTTVRHLLAHRAGLPAPERTLSMAELREGDPVTAQLAAQAPLWEPGSAHAYHALTFGWLAGEVLWRATGQRPRQWLEAHVAGPLGLDVTFGADLADPKVSPLLEQLPVTEPLPSDLLVPPEHVDLIDRAMTMHYSLGRSADDLFVTGNSPEFLSIEIAGGNLVTSARDLARLYAATVADVDGVRLLSSATVADATAPISFGSSWLGTDEGHRWGSGFMLDSRRRGMAGPGSFGHDGAGGQLGFANIEHGVGFGYQTIRPGGYPDDRAEVLCAALRACL